MPSEDLILNVRQIAGYPPAANAPSSAALLMQLAGLGSAYASINPAALVGTALAQGGDMAIGGLLSVAATQGASAAYTNLTANLITAQKATIVNLAATFMSMGGSPVATQADIAASVTSFMGRTGAITLWINDLIAAGGAPLFSPVFGGCPRAPTPDEGSNSSRIATTAFVQRNAVIYIQNLLDQHPFVFTFNGRSGEVVLTEQDILAAGGGTVFDSIALTGIPTAPTAPVGTNTTQIATTAFVQTAINDNTIFAPINSPIFTGFPSGPTASLGTATGQLATTAFVQNAVTASTTGVASFNGRTGAVVLLETDVIAAGGAPLASPAFVGVPTAPTAAPGTANTEIATTAFVAAISAVTSFNTRTGAVTLTTADVTGAGGAPLISPAFSGNPTAPTQPPGDSDTSVATTAFVMAAIAAGTVSSFNGRTGAIVLNSADISAAGGATTVSPIFTGTPTAPTAAPGTNTTQLATTAYVTAALAAGGGVLSFNGRAGAVLLTAGDVVGAWPASAVIPQMNGTAAVGIDGNWSRGDHVHPTDTSRYAASNPSGFQTLAQLNAGLALKLNLTGGQLTGPIGATTGAFSGGVIGANFTASGGLFQVNGNSFPQLSVNNAAGTVLGTYYANGGHIYMQNQVTNGFVMCASTNIFSCSSNAQKPGGGTWIDSSDQRIKNIQGDYAQGLDQILELHPVVYTYKGNDTLSADVSAPRGPLRAGEAAPKVSAAPYPSSIHYQPALDGTEFVGFVAQELEEIMPDMVTRQAGFIDGAATEILNVDITNLVFALVNAIKTLAARVTALEAT
jgi:hypothetical protein